MKKPLREYFRNILILSQKALDATSIRASKDIVHRIMDEAMNGAAALPQENPAPRIGTKTPYRKSQVTKKKPTGRLVARRKVNTVKGRFPNPAEVVKAHGNRHQISYSRNDKDVWLEYRKPGDKKWNRYMAFYNTPAGKKAAVSECKKQALSDKKFEWHVVTP